MAESKSLSTRELVTLGVLIALAFGAAVLVRFGCDDAFISFEYARSLVRGDGLTWFGERVEGYTNFLWVLWIAIGFACGVAPLVWAWVGSLAAMLITLVMAFRLARARSSTSVALVVVGLLGTNFTFVAFATSGLETMLQTALLVTLAHRVDAIVRADVVRSRALVGASALAALAILTRLDSAVVCAVLAAPLAYRLAASRGSARVWLAALLPVALVVGAWLGWKAVYYGDVVPNTARVKLGLSTESVGNGVWYVAGFLHAYLLWVPLIGAVAVAIAKRALPKLPLAIASAWYLYVAAVGGDFMEFRFCVPGLPFLLIAIAEPLIDEPKQVLRGVVLVVALGSYSWRHAVTFDGGPGHRYDSVPALASFYGLVHDDWSRLGSSLRPLAGTPASIATHGAGCIPYFADLPTVDMLGLNDRWIASHGDIPPGLVRPGHQRVAPLQYVIDRKVTFVLGRPTLVHAIPPPQNVLAWIKGSFVVKGPLPKAITIVLIPVDAQTQMLAWYLTPDPAVDVRIRALGWRVLPLSR